MLNAPDAANLLTIARETLLKSLLPMLPSDARYPALMIANAMAAAGRETAQREASNAAELAAFEEFYGEALTRGDPQERLHEFNRRLARDARVGRFEGSGEMELRALLERQVRARLKVSNPKCLARCP